MKRRNGRIPRNLRKAAELHIALEILVALLIIASLSACMAQGGQSTSTTESKQQGATALPTQVLKLAGPDSGLYIASLEDTAVYRVEPLTGKVLWKYQFRLSNTGSYVIPNRLIVQQGQVFVESQSGVVYTIAAATGKLVWSYRFDRTISLIRGSISPMVFSQGRLYVSGVEDERPGLDQLYTLDAQTGKLLRTYKSVRGFAIVKNVLYTSDIDRGPLRAINLEKDQVLWEKTMASQFFMAPYVLAGNVYILSNNQLPAGKYESSIYALDGNTGQLMWHSQNIEGSVSALVPYGDSIYCGESGGKLYAYDAASGHLHWGKDIDFVQNLLVEGNAVYATFNPDKIDPASGNPPVPGIVILDRETGSLIWQKIITTRNAGDPYPDTISGVLVHDGMLYIDEMKSGNGASIKQTTALGTSRKVLWQIKIGGDEIFVS